jgi:hypothetical protein
MDSKRGLVVPLVLGPSARDDISLVIDLNASIHRQLQRNIQKHVEREQRTKRRSEAVIRLNAFPHGLTPRCFKLKVRDT